MIDGSNIFSLKDFLSRFNKDEPVYLVNIKKELIKLYNKDIPINALEKYFLEKGYTNIQLKEVGNTVNSKFEDGHEDIKTKSEVVEVELKKQVDDEDDVDFDPNLFIKRNKERIERISLESSNYKENTWLIENFQKENNIALLNQLLIINRGLVESVANRYNKHTSNKLDFDDLVSEGFLGLMKAINRYDPSLGYQFSTYATWWIRQSITRAIIDKGYNIRIPVHMFETINKVLKYERESILNFNQVDKDWVTKQLDITLEKYNEIKKIDHTFLHLASLDIFVSEEDNDTSLIDFLEYNPLTGIGPESELFLNPEIIATKKELRTLLDEFMRKLKVREREVIEYRFGWNDDHPKTLEEIGVIYNLTRERIRQIEAKAIQKLRTNIEKSKIDLTAF